MRTVRELIAELTEVSQGNLDRQVLIQRADSRGLDVMELDFDVRARRMSLHDNVVPVSKRTMEMLSNGILIIDVTEN